MLKYLDKIKVMAETATNGQECTELVFSKEPGYYSLIIVSRKLHLTRLSYDPATDTLLPSVISKCRSKMVTKRVGKFANGS